MASLTIIPAVQRRRRPDTLGSVVPLAEALPTAWLDTLPQVVRDRTETRALRHARALASGRPPPAQTRAAYLAVMADNASRLHALEQILDAAQEARLSVVPIKGACLAVTHYGDPGARAMCDLDLVCAPQELAATSALLARLGFIEHPHPRFRRAENALHDRQFVRGQVQVELHFALWHEAGICGDPGGVLARAILAPFGSIEAFVPDAADHLYVVLVHAALHAFAGNACWISDALLLAHGHPEIWERVEELAKTTGARIAIAAARDHLAQLAPGRVAPSPRAPAPLRQAILRALAPWLQQGEERLGLLPSRLVKPLLVEGAAPLLRWASQKGRLWLGGLRER